MESLNHVSVPESEREELLNLQELPEHGGAASPEVFGLTSWVSVYNDCTGLYTWPV